jgi:hypothetical protein
MRGNKKGGLRCFVVVLILVVITAGCVGTGSQSADGAGASISGVPDQSFTVTLVDTGNLDTAGIVGPDGGRSAFFSTDDAFTAGAQLKVKRDGFDDVRETKDGANLVGDEECRIRHGAKVVSGVRVDKADIGCSGEQLKGYAQNDASNVVDSGEIETIQTGQRIEYEAGAEYSLVGTVKGDEKVVVSFTAFSDSNTSISTSS